MNTFAYVADNDEYGARAICSKHGYDVQNVYTAEDLGVCLLQVVEAVGEPAWKDVLMIHPDKDAILETLGSGRTSGGGSDCDCVKKSRDAYMPEPSNSLKESHILIFAGALLLAAAIIAKN